MPLQKLTLKLVWCHSNGKKSFIFGLRNVTEDVCDEGVMETGVKDIRLGGSSETWLVSLRNDKEFRRQNPETYTTGETTLTRRELSVYRAIR